MDSVHTRQEPNGTLDTVILPRGMREADLKYKQTVTIRVKGKEKRAVVDLIVAPFWGGPQRAFDYYDQAGLLYHVKVKLVWQESDGGWNEARDVRDATVEEFLAWRSEFNGQVPPTPIPS